MKLHRPSSERVQGLRLRRHGILALLLLAFLLLLLFLPVALKASSTTISVTSGLDLQRSSVTNARIHAIEENTSSSSGEPGDIELQSIEDKQEAQDIAAGQPHLAQRNGAANLQYGHAPNIKKEEEHTDHISPESAGEGEAPAAKSPITCDFSAPRSDTCVMEGDVRLLPYFSTLLLVEGRTTEPPSSWKLRPYARKWEAPVMEQIKELALKGPVAPQDSPPCDARHAVPAVVFSTGGFQGNFFHDFTDVLVPLFITARQYAGEVQLLAADYNAAWVRKYDAILRRLSRYEVVDLGRDASTRCFPKAHVGLLSHRELGVDAGKAPGGHSMAGFRELLRRSFSLKRRSVAAAAGRRPRLMVVRRKGSRSLLNEGEVVAMARRVGYRVVVAGPEKARDLARFARAVNSCDVLVGVHGAGLTNMVFLPANATVIQVVPWGALGYASRHDFGNPAPEMGLRYMEYEITKEESSLIQQYPRDHPVFTDPFSIHEQGWNALWYIFLHQQHIRLDVRRFRGVLQEALRSLR